MAHICYTHPTFLHSLNLNTHSIFYSHLQWRIGSPVANLVGERLPDGGDHGDVDDRVEHPVEQGQGQGPVQPHGARYRGRDGGREEDQTVGTNGQEEEPGQENHLDCNRFQGAGKSGNSGNSNVLFTPIDFLHPTWFHFQWQSDAPSPPRWGWSTRWGWWTWWRSTTTWTPPGKERD